ncbi:hypothetical protein VFPPC_17460 [Pochonia chlamydosporia 170]|uniref:Uncharacterized protein n=1 Tax=Pochonia chlamydosporia 170 TaxID=1380566 RepID=A0A219ARG9_METCM|nr:hypothetical protein VFPPC_17460 [Pochonia chlamydosporia 170]OWT43377.1 hypothetical protein VFPPC_17460 [Pochonia chlamydosporia 170]
MSDTESNIEPKTGPILSKVWVLLLPPVAENSEANWAIAISDMDNRDWTCWEMVKSRTGEFQSKLNASDMAPATANSQGPIFLGEIARLDALEMGSTIALELTERPKCWTRREFVSEIWDTLYHDGALNWAEHDIGKQQLAAVFSGHSGRS